MRGSQILKVFLVICSIVNFALFSWMFTTNLKVMEKADRKYFGTVRGNKTLSFTLPPHQQAKITMNAEDGEDVSPEHVTLKIIALEINMNKTLLFTKEYHSGQDSQSYEYDNIFEFRNILNHSISYDLYFFPNETGPYELGIVHNFEAPVILYLWIFIFSSISTTISIPFLVSVYKKKKKDIFWALLTFINFLLWLVFSLTFSFWSFTFVVSF